MRKEGMWTTGCKKGRLDISCAWPGGVVLPSRTQGTRAAGSMLGGLSEAKNDGVEGVGGVESLAGFLAGPAPIAPLLLLGGEADTEGVFGSFAAFVFGRSGGDFSRA